MLAAALQNSTSPFTILWADSTDDKLMTFFFFFTENMP